MSDLIITRLILFRGKEPTMRTLTMIVESFSVTFLWLGSLFLSLYGFITSQILLGVLGIIVFVIAFSSMLYVWTKHPETRNDTYNNPLWNTREHLSRAFYNWESLPR